MEEIDYEALLFAWEDLEPGDFVVHRRGDPRVRPAFITTFLAISVKKFGRIIHWTRLHQNGKIDRCEVQGVVKVNYMIIRNGKIIVRWVDP